jgi:hypothetical protein
MRDYPTTRAAALRRALILATGLQAVVLLAYWVGGPINPHGGSGLVVLLVLGFLDFPGVLLSGVFSGAISSRPEWVGLALIVGASFVAWTAALYGIFSPGAHQRSRPAV